LRRGRGAKSYNTHICLSGLMLLQVEHKHSVELELRPWTFLIWVAGKAGQDGAGTF
jgi:hypothetical protein